MKKMIKKTFATFYFATLPVCVSMSQRSTATWGREKKKLKNTQHHHSSSYHVVGRELYIFLLWEREMRCDSVQSSLTVSLTVSNFCEFIWIDRHSTHSTSEYYDYYYGFSSFFISTFLRDISCVSVQLLKTPTILILIVISI